MKEKTIEQKIEWISTMHKQNLNGRETEDELFEKGIRAGIEETESAMLNKEHSIKNNMNKYKDYIADFPEEVVEKMLERQVEHGNKRDVSVFERGYDAYQGGGGFNWGDTIEGYPFWFNIFINKNFDLFFKKYPKEEIGNSEEDAIDFRYLQEKDVKAIKKAREENNNMTKFIDTTTKEKKEKKETVFTHCMSSSNGWEAVYSTMKPSAYDEVKYLGCCPCDGDMFAANYRNGNIMIFKGIKGDEFE